MPEPSNHFHNLPQEPGSQDPNVFMTLSVLTLSIFLTYADGTKAVCNDDPGDPGGRKPQSIFLIARLNEM